MDRWKLRFGKCKEAPPKGWRLYLREGWMGDEWVNRYRLYLKSWAWEAKRRGAIKRTEGKCQICSSTEHLQVHHVTYERVGLEQMQDLRVLCASCHRVRHSLPTGAAPIPLDPVTRRKREVALTEKLNAPPAEHTEYRNVRRRPKAA